MNVSFVQQAIAMMLKMTITIHLSLTWVRFSCKCVKGAYFFRDHKSITIKVSWADQDLVCSPEKVEGSLFIETVWPLHLRSII